MDFKLVSKNNMGIVITLILVILLSQSRFFDFLTETALGRMFILMLIILISYTNKFLGLLAVLFIIIAFNQYDMNVVQSYNYYEGFDGSGNSTASAVLNDKITFIDFGLAEFKDSADNTDNCNRFIKFLGILDDKFKTVTDINARHRLISTFLKNVDQT